MRRQAGGLRLSMKLSPAETLVMYSHANKDTEFDGNMRFFVRFGMWEGDGCDYVIIVQEAHPFIVATPGKQPSRLATRHYALCRSASP